jgi:hypothetical protein
LPFLLQATHVQAALITNESSNLLSNPGFEPGTPAFLPPGVPGVDRWSEENADLIIGENFGIIPFEGNGMVRLNDTGGVTSQLGQFIDVGSWAAEIDAGNLAVSLSALYNSPTPETIVSTLVVARSDVSYSGSSLIEAFEFSLTLDSSLETWETVSLGVDNPVFLPPGTRFIDAEVIAINNTIPDGAFVDAVDLRVASFQQVKVPEPATILGTATAIGFGMLLKRKQAN